MPKDFISPWDRRLIAVIDAGATTGEAAIRLGVSYAAANSALSRLRVRGLIGKRLTGHAPAARTTVVPDVPPSRAKPRPTLAVRACSTCLASPVPPKTWYCGPCLARAEEVSRRVNATRTADSRSPTEQRGRDAGRHRRGES